MKRTLALVLAMIMLLGCLSACANERSASPTAGRSPTSAQTENTQATQATEPTQAPTEQQERPLTCDDIIAYIADYTESADSISTPERTAGETAGQITTRFTVLGECVSVTVIETDGIVDSLMTIAHPSKFAALAPNASVDEVVAAAYAFAMVPLYACEPELGGEWHTEQFLSAPEEGEDTLSIRSYTSNEWIYTTMMGTFLTCIAARYCSQCGNNGTNVSFPPNSPICENCANSNTSSGNTSSGNTSSGNTSSGNTSSGNTSSGNTGAPVQTTPPCSHSYSQATCTAPKTCTLCGRTEGSALGHSYTAATCTTPGICSVCGNNNGMMAAHTWEVITETVYHEERGHYEDVEVAKKSKRLSVMHVAKNRTHWKNTILILTVFMETTTIIFS